MTTQSDPTNYAETLASAAQELGVNLFLPLTPDQANRLMVAIMDQLLDQYDGDNAEDLIFCLSYARGYTKAQTRDA